MIRHLLTLAFGAALAGSASAILNFNIDAPQDPSAVAGSSVTFSGTITGVTGDVLLANCSIDSVRTSTGSTYLTGAFTPQFLAYVALNTTADYAGTIATFNIPVVTPAGIYDTDNLGNAAQIVVGGVNAKGKNVNDNEFFSVDVQAVPEPATMAVMGLAGAGMLRRRRKA